MQRQKLIYGVTGQTISIDCPEGRPSGTPTCSVYRQTAGDDATAEFSPTAAVETSPNTTVDAESGYGSADPRKLSLTATTGIVTGRVYRLSESATVEWVEPVRVVSADYIEARAPLAHRYTTSAVFVSTRISATVDPTWVATASKLSDATSTMPGYRVRWAYVVGGVTYVAYSYCDLVRAPGHASVTWRDVEPYIPQLLDKLPTFDRGDQGAARLEAAYREVVADLRRADCDEDQVRDQEVIDRLTALKAAVLWAEVGVHPSQFSAMEFVEVRRSAYRAELEQMIRVVTRTSMAVGASGAGVTVSAIPIWSR